jgi:Flp pilus assembly protein TadG
MNVPNGVIVSSVGRRGQRGAAMIEIALVTPILLSIAVAIAQFGIFVFNYQSLVNAVQMGAEQVSISRGITTDPCATVVNTVTAAQQGLITGSLSYSLTINNGTPITTTSCPSSASSLVQGAPIVVKVSYPCNLKIYGQNLIPSCSMVSQMTEVIQ